MCTLRPCRCSVELRPVADIGAVHAGPPGGFCIRSCQDGDQHYLRFWVKLPCEGGSVHALPLAPAQPSGKNKAKWSWDGNRERPTLTPSIRSSIAEPPADEDPAKPSEFATWKRVEVWHGFITAGRAQSL